MRFTYSRVSRYGGTPLLRATAPAPALYAASDLGTSPPKFSSSARRWRTPPSRFCSGSKGLATFSSRAVAGISCIRPSAPLRDTALGLKLDSTLITARTRLGSTWCRAAAASIAASRSAALTVRFGAEAVSAGALAGFTVAVLTIGAGVEAATISGAGVTAPLLALVALASADGVRTGTPLMPRYCETSAAAVRAARMVVREASGTGFQRCSVWLQYMSVYLREARADVAGRVGTAARSLT